MPAAYPANVKTFTNKTDNTDTVFASNVNDLQSEVVAVETAVGKNPASWAGVTLIYPPATPQSFANTLPYPPYPSMTAPATYLSLADRVNQLQAQVAWLTAVNNRPVNTGPPIWRGPISIIRCPGFPFLPGFGNWQYYPWGATDYDPNGMFQGGTTINCPQTGWWRISLQIWADVAQVAGIHHANAKLFVNNVEAGTDGSQVQVGVIDQHRMNLSWEGPWHAGQTVAAQFMHAPGDGNSASVMSRSTISLSYLRDIS